MSDDQTEPYPPGTWVWAKVPKRMTWWPVQIVNLDSIPDELKYNCEDIKKAKTAVIFKRNKSYEIITNLDKVCHYSCARKMEFIEKGYLLYARQKKNGFVAEGNEMRHFIFDVKNVEREIGGDHNIFVQIIKKYSS